MAEVQYGMVIITTRCVGCQTCTISCKISNEVAGDVYWSRVEGKGTDAVYRVVGTFPNVTIGFQPELCNHCADAACVNNCPTGAMHKDGETGLTLGDDEICISCGTCVKACPYSIPKLDAVSTKMCKCDLCLERLSNEELPWCVQSCPGEARIVGDLNDPNSEVAKIIAERKAVQLSPELGTNPNVYYVM